VWQGVPATSRACCGWPSSGIPGPVGLTRIVPHALWRTRVCGIGATDRRGGGCTLAGWRSGLVDGAAHDGATGGRGGELDTGACALARRFRRVRTGPGPRPLPRAVGRLGSGFAGTYIARRISRWTSAERGGVRLRVASALQDWTRSTCGGVAEQWPVLIADWPIVCSGRCWRTPKLLDRSLPAAVLPKTQPGLLAFRRADGCSLEARWARPAGPHAAATLSTRPVGSVLRHAEVGSVARPEDDPRDNHYLAHVDASPSLQRLIRAQQLPLAARLIARRADRGAGETSCSAIRRGEELLHRGPLVGARGARHWHRSRMSSSSSRRSVPR